MFGQSYIEVFSGQKHTAETIIRRSGGKMRSKY